MDSEHTEPDPKVEKVQQPKEEKTTEPEEVNEIEKTEPTVEELEKSEPAAAEENEKTEPEELENDPEIEEEKEQSEEMSPEKELPEVSPEPSEEVKRDIGRVFQYYNRKGYGFIIPTGGAERDKVFAHWKSIKSQDRWPLLIVGQEVEYTLSYAEKGRKQAAIDITMVGGNEVSNDRKPQHVTSERYLGKVKFYDIQKGYGFIELTQEAQVNDETLEAESDVHVGREHIITTDNCPALTEGMEVEFNLAKIESKVTALSVTEKGKEFVSAPQAFQRNNYRNRSYRNRDRPIYDSRRSSYDNRRPRNNFRRDRRQPRAEVNQQIHHGTIASFNNIKGFGWITPKEDLSDCGVNMEENGGKLFVHRNDLHNVHSVEGTDICFQLKFDNGSCTAVNVTPSQQFITDFNPYVISVQILESQVGSIIGRKGANIRQLQRTCKAQVQVKDPSEQNPGKRIINITGNPQNIKHACQLIHQKLYERNEEVEYITFTFLFHDMYNQLSADGAAQQQFDKIPNIKTSCSKTFQIQGTQMSSLDLEGERDVIKQGIEHAVDLLCKLYMDTLSDYFQQISATSQYYYGFYNNQQQLGMQQQQQQQHQQNPF